MGLLISVVPAPSRTTRLNQSPAFASWRFPNTQSPGITCAITGPWRQGIL